MSMVEREMPIVATAVNSAVTKGAEEASEWKPNVDSDVLTYLSGTPYECYKLESLSGGQSNFTYQGRLRCPLPDGSNTIIIKHSRSFTAGETGFSVPTSRSSVEHAFLQTMNGRSFSATRDASIRPPRHYYFDPQTNTQVMEDIPHCERLRDYLLSAASKDIHPATATSVGETLGVWLASFHSQDWSHIEKRLPAALEANKCLWRNVHDSMYEYILSLYDDPTIREGAQQTLARVNAKRSAAIHADFSTKKCPHTVDLAVVDWEVCQLGSNTVDLAFMISGLYAHHRFEDGPTAGFILQGFTTGYGPLNDDLVFETAVLVGIYLVIWDRLGLQYGEHSQGSRDLHKFAGELITRGSRHDRPWVANSFLKGFLRGSLCSLRSRPVDLQLVNQESSPQETV